jgi:hypothetical protein
MFCRVVGPAHEKQCTETMRIHDKKHQNASTFFVLHLLAENYYDTCMR